jgi:hypothetical protein
MAAAAMETGVSRNHDATPCNSLPHPECWLRGWAVIAVRAVGGWSAQRPALTPRVAMAEAHPPRRNPMQQSAASGHALRAPMRSKEKGGTAPRSAAGTCLAGARRASEIDEYDPMNREDGGRPGQVWLTGRCRTATGGRHSPGRSKGGASENHEYDPMNREEGGRSAQVRRRAGVAAHWAGGTHLAGAKAAYSGTANTIP